MGLFRRAGVLTSNWPKPLPILGFTQCWLKWHGDRFLFHI
jgi:hypothetical protein